MEAGSGNLALMHCSCLHACLAAFWNILRRELNTTCITINCGVWRHGTWTDQQEVWWAWRLLKQAFNKKRDKNHIKGGQYLWSTVICSTEYEQSDWESIRRLFQSVRSYEEIRGAFDSKGDWRLQSPVSMTVNGDCSTSYLHQRLVYESGRRRLKQWSTSQHLDDGWSRLNSEVYYKVMSALSCLHSLVCKA